jgi:photosystem I P700 chlorophyll a apoprotein A1
MGETGHFSRVLAKVRQQLGFNLHADAHDLMHTLPKIFLEKFLVLTSQLGIIFIWLSGMYFHGARFSNYEA